MDFTGQRTSPQHRGLPRALLVMALLTGLLGMHGLVLGGLPGGSVTASAPAHHEAVQPPAHEDTGTGHDQPAVAAAPASHTGTDSGACHGGQGSGQGSEHADQTCASGAVPGPPAPPALALSMDSPAAPAAQATRPAVHEPYGGRAPPSLEELQLLRV